jgi:hypothetical protein
MLGVPNYPEVPANSEFYWFAWSALGFSSPPKTFARGVSARRTPKTPTNVLERLSASIFPQVLQSLARNLSASTELLNPLTNAVDYKTRNIVNERPTEERLMPLQLGYWIKRGPAYRHACYFKMPRLERRVTEALALSSESSTFDDKYVETAAGDGIGCPGETRPAC